LKKRRVEEVGALETMSMFKRVRLMQRTYEDRNRRSNKTDTVVLSQESLVKRQRVFEWVSETLHHWEDIYDERKQTEFSNSLDKTYPLHFASFHGDSNIVQHLLDQGVDVNGYAYWDRVTTCGKIQRLPYTALEAAASGGHRHIVKLLMMHGADPSIVAEIWGTPLVIAARRHDTKLARILMDYGADVNQLSVYSYSSGQTMTALQRASCEGDLEMVTLLLNRGAEVNISFGHYGPALVAAAINENPLLVDQLLDAGAEINAVHRIGPKANCEHRLQTALVRAISNNHVSVVRLLLDRGADIYMECECGNAVQNAAYFGQEEILDELILRGADINKPSKSFNTVLEAAAAGSQQILFKKLVAFGMNVHAPCAGSECNLLYVAAKSGAYEIVEFLLQKGMDVNARGGYHGCALTAAVSGGHLITSRLLIENGASFSILSHEGTSALQAGVRYGDLEVVRLLLDAGASVNVVEGKYGSMLQWAALNTPEPVVHLLLDRGINLNLQGGYFGNALQAWSYIGNEDIVKTLLEKGANPLARGGFYDTAMNAACHEGHLLVMNLLREHGAPLPLSTDMCNVAADAD
jgi:ankyrin repeat protein